jgi:hypothetical protein
MVADSHSAIIQSRENLANIKHRIEQTAQSCDRPASDVTLVAVSKTIEAIDIEPVIAAGHRIFGENRVQEAETKWPDLKAQTGDLTLHLIGPLQTNKVRVALGLFDVIETLDRPKLARRLALLMDETGFRPDLFIQVNTGEEEQKAGVMPGACDDFVKLCRDELNLPVIGLMCIPPADEEPSLHFALLRKIARRNGLENLSMGMSADFDIAVEFDATHVRVGTAIFGRRPPFKATI